MKVPGRAVDVDRGGAAAHVGADARLTAEAASEAEAAAPPRPESTRDLFFTFNRLALQGFGGVLAVAQRELVERKRWLTREEFVEMLALSQVLPGPNVVNLALMFGDRFFGLRGAMAAVGGMLLVPLVIVLALAAAYAEFARVPVVSGALRGMGAVAAGLVVATAVKLMRTLGTSRLGLPMALTLAALTFVAIALLRWPLAWVVLGLGSCAVAVAYARSR
jgi:chromate transporter